MGDGEWELARGRESGRGVEGELFRAMPPF